MTPLETADASREAGDIVAAIACYLRVLDADPSSTYARYWLATCYQDVGELENALQQCDAGLRGDPGQIGLLLRKASVAIAASDHFLALECYLEAAAADPDIPDIDALIGDRYCFLGQVATGVKYFERALRGNPESTRLQSNLLFVLNYAEILTREQLFKRHKEWGARHEATCKIEWRAHCNSLLPERRLRVGYVSGDLRNHAVAFFVEPLLRRHDPEQVAVYCYDTSTFQEDDVAARLRSYGHTWRKVGTSSDAAVDEAIRADEIDILVDLSGHTVLNRLTVFARKPAPVQATWLGYLGTTGLSTMDYRITDAYLDPPGTTEGYHTEQLLRLPNAACFTPPADAPSVGELPAIRNRIVTFGSINQWSKVNDDVRATWAELLRAVPNSRLVVVAPGGRNPQFAAEVAKGFASHGIETRRIDVRATMRYHQFLELFHDIDVTLDPFPYGGGTTTMHSLWMGVPVVTLGGKSAFARNSVGPLMETGLHDLIAGSHQDYVQRAVSAAADTIRLRDIRWALRARLVDSPLLDQVLFVRRMEEAYRDVWRRYCARHQDKGPHR